MKCFFDQQTQATWTRPLSECRRLNVKDFNEMIRHETEINENYCRLRDWTFINQLAWLTWWNSARFKTKTWAMWRRSEINFTWSLKAHWLFYSPSVVFFLIHSTNSSSEEVCCIIFNDKCASLWWLLRWHSVQLKGHKSDINSCNMAGNYSSLWSSHVTRHNLWIERHFS